MYACVEEVLQFVLLILALIAQMSFYYIMVIMPFGEKREQNMDFIRDVLHNSSCNQLRSFSFHFETKNDNLTMCSLCIKNMGTKTFKQYLLKYNKNIIIKSLNDTD